MLTRHKPSSASAITPPGAHALDRAPLIGVTAAGDALHVERVLDPRRDVYGSIAVMTATEARIEVLAAAVRAVAQSLTPEQAVTANAMLIEYLRPLTDRPLPDVVGSAMAREVAGLIVALAH